ncbi:nuclear transport factor 2 family protein [Candidatus Poriferisocius sp.]|uniref:nuclear transport factor 2 family protein n=1 Tax=Candidatus Poriferisocius sp. TaxID=3101276 RepID=UPI003B597BB6
MNMPNPEDRLAIEDVIVRYTVAIDEKDWDLLDTVFTPDARLDYSSSAPDVPEAAGDYPTVKGWLQAALSIFPMTQHLVGKTYIRSWDGDTAQCTTLFHNPMGMPVADDGKTFDPNGPKQFMFFVGGWYHDTVTRTPDGFRITQKIETSGYHEGGFPEGFAGP